MSNRLAFYRNSLSRPRRQRMFPTFAVAIAAASLVVLAACGSSSDGADEDSSDTSGDPQSVAVNEEVRALLPESIRSSGTLAVATTPTYPPYEYLDADTGDLTGQNVDVVEALGDLLGVKVEWSFLDSFGSIVPGIISERYDSGIIFEDSVERQEVVDIVSFYRTGIAFLGEAGSKIELEDACGSKVAVGTGNGPDLLSKDINKLLCTSKDRPAIEFLNFANTNGQFSALTSGRVEYVLLEESVGRVFAEDSDGKYAVRSDVFARRPVGVPISKERPDVTKALEAGLKVLFDDGTLKEIFTEWNTMPQLEATDKVATNVVTPDDDLLEALR